MVNKYLKQLSLGSEPIKKKLFSNKNIKKYKNILFLYIKNTFKTIIKYIN
jgi:hypothetical protein